MDGSIPVIALTATATKVTRDTIMKDLSMKDCIQIVINPGKANVKYSVENCGKDTLKQSYKEATFKLIFCF